MADSLTLRGVKEIRNQTGDELKLILPKVGDTHLLNSWSIPGNIPTACTLFEVNVGGTITRLAIQSGMDSEIDIVHDGNGNFTFPNSRGIEKAAVMDENFEVTEALTFNPFPGVPPTSSNPNNDGGGDNGGGDNGGGGGSDTGTQGETGTAAAGSYTLNLPDFAGDPPFIEKYEIYIEANEYEKHEDLFLCSDGSLTSPATDWTIISNDARTTEVVTNTLPSTFTFTFTDWENSLDCAAPTAPDVITPQDAVTVKADGTTVDVLQKNKIEEFWGDGGVGGVQAKRKQWNLGRISIYCYDDVNSDSPFITFGMNSPTVVLLD